MEKKRYIIPQVSVMNMENLSIIATSNPNVVTSGGTGTGSTSSTLDMSQMSDGDEEDMIRSAERINFDDWE